VFYGFGKGFPSAGKGFGKGLPFAGKGFGKGFPSAGKGFGKGLPYTSSSGFTSAVPSTTVATTPFPI
jgi:hypothetical protein